MTVIKAVITTLDNLSNLKEQLAILKDDPILTELIVVNNGSMDGTRDWLENQPGVIAIHRENKGAGPGRNAGLSAAGWFDFVLMLDGGIRPLRGGASRMLDYLERHPDVHVVGVEIPHFETDETKAWPDWPDAISDQQTYRNTRLSHTACCLARYAAFDGLRFCEEGPFGEPGWGVDDDEMAYQWNEAGIVAHAVTGVHPYRRASGSFQRLFRETGIWPNQYGSVYEQRLVWRQQNWPQYRPGVQWGEPWLTVVIQVSDPIEKTIELIKRGHDRLRKRRFNKPWDHLFNPYSIVAWCPANPRFLTWAEPRRLRQNHGDTAIIGGQIRRRTSENEATWTGDFRICCGQDWQDSVRPNAHYYGIVSDVTGLEKLLLQYNTVHPTGDSPPTVNRHNLVISTDQA